MKIKHKSPKFELTCEPFDRPILKSKGDLLTRVLYFLLQLQKHLWRVNPLIDDFQPLYVRDISTIRARYINNTCATLGIEVEVEVVIKPFAAAGRIQTLLWLQVESKPFYEAGNLKWGLTCQQQDRSRVVNMNRDQTLWPAAEHDSWPNALTWVVNKPFDQQQNMNRDQTLYELRNRTSALDVGVEPTLEFMWTELNRDQTLLWVRSLTNRLTWVRSLTNHQTLLWGWKPKMRLDVSTTGSKLWIVTKHLWRESWIVTKPFYDCRSKSKSLTNHLTSSRTWFVTKPFRAAGRIQSWPNPLELQVESKPFYEFDR
jgi:hypothetical protein